MGILIELKCPFEKKDMLSTSDLGVTDISNQIDFVHLKTMVKNTMIRKTI